MVITIDDLTYEIFPLGGDKMRIIISLYEKELGTLYFEKAKRSFVRKPVSMDGWCVIDAKIEGLYVVGGDNITPKNIVDYCQKLLKSSINN
jgi:hypothetical protein